MQKQWVKDGQTDKMDKEEKGQSDTYVALSWCHKSKSTCQNIIMYKIAYIVKSFILVGPNFRGFMKMGTFMGM